MGGFHCRAKQLRKNRCRLPIFAFFCLKNITMLRSYRLLLAFLFFAPLAVFAQIEYPKDAFRELRRGLEGTWFMPTDRGDRLEIWEIENDSTLAGRAVRIKPENGDTVLIEKLRIAFRDTTVTYSTIARAPNNEPVPYTLTTIDEQGFFIFVNPEHDDPQKIKYLLLSNREVQVSTEGRRNGRTVTQEYVFEREFTPGAVEFRLKAGINGQTLHGTGNFNLDNNQSPEFGWKPGWEIGTQVRFKGRGGYITINAEISLVGRYGHVKSEFSTVEDTTYTKYKRDLTYRTTWLSVGILPEISFQRDGRFSMMAGPYYARQVSAGGKVGKKDLTKNDVGITMGLQYRLNIGKKDLGGILGLRWNMGLSNLDNLYKLYCGDTPSALCNASVGFRGATLYYSVDLGKF
jgi:hypothetical protein